MTSLDPRREFATEVVARLQNAGFQALWAGGCVRDLILGEEPADFDVATDARPEQVMNLFRRNVPVGASFGVVRVLGPANMDVEVATFRTDGVYLDGRRPETVKFADAQRDAERRDFTINGMFLDPMGGEVLDFVGGRRDLEARVVRAIGNPSERFTEDKLRLLRATRFAARFHFAIDRATRRALEAMADQVRVVAAERIAQELRKILVHPSRAEGLALAMDTGLVEAILPPVARMRGLPQAKPAQPDGDLWDHTRLVLSLLPSKPSGELAFAALLHDVGKPETYSLNSEGRATFHSHEQVGRKIAERVARDLKLANAERERIAWLVEYHQYLGEPTVLREAKLKRILAEPGIEDLLALHRADAMATTGRADNVDYCETYLRDQPTGPINPPPLVTGHDLARHGLKPGPRFKQYLEQVYEAQLERQVQSKKEALEWLDRYEASLDHADQA